MRALQNLVRQTKQVRPAGRWMWTVLLVFVMSGCTQPLIVTPVGSPVPTPTPTATARPAATVTATPTRPFLPTYTPTPGPTPRPMQDTTNILLLGSDRRGARGTGRTDVMIVVAVDSVNQRVGVVSLPRDLYVNIPGVGQQRINTADVYGELRRPGSGISLVKETIESNLGIPIDKYVRIDFEGFIQVIDALGGITVTVDCPLHETWRDPAAPGDAVRLDFEPGDHHMDGRTAMWYVRTRRQGNDLDRGRRQQRVLVGLKNRAEEANLLPQVPALFNALRGNVDTDLSLLDVVALARLGVELDPGDIHSRVFDFTMARPYRTSGGASVLLPNQPAILKAFDTIWDAPDVITSTDRSQKCP